MPCCNRLPCWYLHLVEGIFGWVWEHACLSELENCAGGSLVAGMTTHATKVWSKVPDKQRQSGPEVWGLGMGLTSSPCKNTVVSCLEIPRMGRPWHKSGLNHDRRRYLRKQITAEKDNVCGVMPFVLQLCCDSSWVCQLPKNQV